MANKGNKVNQMKAIEIIYVLAHWIKFKLEET
jgi:hypothetical protein